MATDATMSATRQITNWIAYGQLLRELGGGLDGSGTPPRGQIPNRSGWSSPLSADPTIGYGSPVAASVEILELGWRPTTARAGKPHRSLSPTSHHGLWP